MRQTINIRKADDKSSVGSYDQIRNSVRSVEIKRTQKRQISVTSSSDPNKIKTTKPLEDQSTKE